MNTTENGQPLGLGLSEGLGLVPSVPFCRVRDVMSTAMAMTLRQDPGAGLFTEAQLLAAVAAEIERWAATFARESEAIAQDDAPLHRGYKLALSDMAAKMRA